MAGRDALGDPGILLPGPVVECHEIRTVASHGGTAVLPHRHQALAADAAGLGWVQGWDQVPEASATQIIVHQQKSRSATRADCAAAWRCLVEDGRLLICGDNTLGIASLLKSLNQEMETAVDVAAQRAHGRIGLVRRRGRGPGRPEPACVPLWPPGIIDPPAASARLFVDPGVFSARGLDPGTALVLGILRSSGGSPHRILDIGCGAGHLAIASLLLNPEAEADLLDGDARAVACARENVRRFGLSDRARVHWWDVSEDPPGTAADLVLVNPPCHAGRDVDLALGTSMLRAAARCRIPGGRLIAVANRQLPYEHHLRSLGQVRILLQEQGYKIIEVSDG